MTARTSAAIALASGEPVEAAYELTEQVLAAPVSAGTQVGEAVYSVNGTELARVPLVAGEQVPDASAPERGVRLWRNVFKN